MPSGVFKPYAGVSTAVMIFTKTGTGGTNNVWFYDMKADGYSLDDKRVEVKDNDIADIIKRYHSLKAEVKRKRSDKSFFVPISEIKVNDWDLSISRYKEVVHKEMHYSTPANIIKEIKDLEHDRAAAFKTLEKLLK